MDQYPQMMNSMDSVGGETTNYSYDYGIYASCDKDNDYIRAYDEGTRHLNPATCSANCAGCDADAGTNKSKKSSNDGPNLQIVPGINKPKESFTPQYSPAPPQYYLPPPPPPPTVSDNNEKFNIVIIILLAFIVLILLMNNKQQNVRYVYLPQNNAMLGNSMFNQGGPQIPP